MNGQNPYGYGPSAGRPPAQPSPYGPGSNHPPPQQQQQHYQQAHPMQPGHGAGANHYGYPTSQAPYTPQHSVNPPPPSPYSYSPATPSAQYPAQSPTPYDNQQQQSPYQGGSSAYSPLAGPSRPHMPQNNPPMPTHAQGYGGAPDHLYQPPHSQQSYNPSFARPPPQTASSSPYPAEGAYDPRVPQNSAGNGATGGSGSSEDAAMRAYMARSRPRPPPTSVHPPAADPRLTNNSGMIPSPSSQMNSGAYNGYSSIPHAAPVGRPLSGPPPGVDIRGAGNDFRTEAEKAASAWRNRQQPTRPFVNGPPPFLPPAAQSGPQTTASRPPPPAGYNYTYTAPQRPQARPSSQTSLGRPPLPSVTLPSQPSTPTSQVSRSGQIRPAPFAARPTPPSTLPARPPSSAGWPDRRTSADPSQTQWGRRSQNEATTAGLPRSHGRLPLPSQQNVPGRGSPPGGARARAPIPARPVSARSRSPPSRRKSDSRTPTPDPLQEVFLVGLDPDVTPDQLHEMIDELCSSSDLTTADEVLLLRDRTTRVLNGRAIATFPRIADAIRFANAHGPWIEDVERFFGQPPKAEGEQSGDNETKKRKKIRVNHGGNASDDGDEKAKAAPASLETDEGRGIEALDMQADGIKEEDTTEGVPGDSELTHTVAMASPSGPISPANASSDSHSGVPGKEIPEVEDAPSSDLNVSLIKEETPDQAIARSASATDATDPAAQPQTSEGDEAVASSSGVADTTGRPEEAIAAESPATEAVTAPAGNTSAPPASESTVDVPALQSKQEPLLTPTEAEPSSTVAPLLGTGEKRTSQLLSNKKVALNIANWTKKQEELHSTLPTSATSAALSSLPDEAEHDSAQDTVSPASADAVVEGTPPADVDIDFFSDRTALCCYLCGRKFKTMDVLNRHPRESKLHSANLLEEDKRRSGGEAVRKARAATSSAGMKRKAGPSGFVPVQSGPANDSGEATGETRYRDRALERRAVFGSENSAPASKKAKGTRSFEGPAAPAPTPAPRGVEEKIEEDNVGNKMLQMMGWTEGEVLGNTGGGLDKPIEAIMYAKGAGLGAGSAGKSIGGPEAAGSTPGWKARLDQAREGRLSRYEEADSGRKEDSSS